MYFVKPNNETYNGSTFYVSHDTKTLLLAYSCYTNVTEDEIIDTLVKNVVLDEGFMKWLAEEKAEISEDKCLAEALTITEKILNEK